MGGNEPDYDADNPLLRSSQPVDERAHLTDAFTREANDFITRHRTQPFFLYLAYNAVHSPLQAADAYLAKFAHIPDLHRRIFAAMLAHLDDSVGSVVAHLRAQGIAENTLIVFLSDNGGPTKELTSSNAPLRGGKGELFEGGIRVPFIVSWPGRIAPRALDTPVISLDATATALGLAGISSTPSPLDGVNLWPLLSGKSGAAPHAALYWRVGERHAIRHGDWKLLRQRGAWQLYHLAKDVGEHTDRASAEPARTQELAGLWEAWNSEQTAPRWK
jgi:arylsulfatase B